MKNSQSKKKPIKTRKEMGAKYCLGCKDYTDSFKSEEVKMTTNVFYWTIKNAKKDHKLVILMGMTLCFFLLVLKQVNAVVVGTISIIHAQSVCFWCCKT